MEHTTDDRPAPLQISKSTETSGSNINYSRSSPRKSTHSVSSTHPTTHSQRLLQMTPPLTPQEPVEQLTPPVIATQPQFDNFIRATYSFHPEVDDTSATVTLPLNKGDIILVHSVHTNGWADGTLLESGHRGWLPTNFCDPYEPEAMRNILVALTNFWDVLRDCGEDNYAPLYNQDYMRGIIAGVRSLLVQANCLTREDPLLAQQAGKTELRRARKIVLSELSALNKLTRSIEMKVRHGQVSQVMEEESLDHMIMAAFKVTVRAVRFHDVWAEEAAEGTVFIEADTGINQSISSIPPTPPADKGSFRDAAEGRDHGDETHQNMDVESTQQQLSQPSLKILHPVSREEQINPPLLTEQDLQRKTQYRSSLNLARPESTHFTGPSVSHRVSWSAQPSQNGKLASERLYAAHGAFLTFLGAFIGPHLFSRSSVEILVTTQQSVNAGRALLTVVEAVWERGCRKSEQLTSTRDNMYAKITEMVLAAQNIFSPSGSTDEENYSQEDRKVLADAATRCIRGAGECVATTRYALQLIGDFEFETIEDQSLLGDFDSAEPRPETPHDECPHLDETNVSVSSGASSTTPLAPQDLPRINTDAPTSPSNRMSTSSLLPPVPSLASSISSSADYSPLSMNLNNNSMEFQPRTDSLADVGPAPSSTYVASNRDSKVSSISSSTMPDVAPDTPATSVWKDSPSISFSSTSDQETEAEDGESTVLEQTYAHEIMFNKDGQIMGGSLPALIERLTTHDSTPDALFVATFYLTFRIFTTPVSFAQCLVDRFNYVGSGKRIKAPVQLRVYNVFKGWLESHWRMDCDKPALDIIMPFATTELQASLPAAGKRLLELANKVSETTSPLVPRLVSSIGKTHTSVAQYIAPDTPLPLAVVSSKQMNLLKAWKAGGGCPGIMDFDPLEFARQLTLKQSRIFCSILPEELLGTEWTKKTGSIAVNVRAMSALSTDVANLVTSTILESFDQKLRAKMIKQWVKIASKCLDLQNFDAVMAIVCSLTSTTVTRLKRTWECVSSRTIATLEKLKPLIECTRNYTTLRQTLACCMPSCLPFVGMYLTDLTFVDAGNQSTRILPSSGQTSPTTGINFDKHMKTAKIISELQRFQIPYRLQEVPELQTWLQDQLVRVRSSDEAEGSLNQHYRRSCILEPKEPMQAKASPILPMPTKVL